MGIAVRYIQHHLCVLAVFEHADGPETLLAVTAVCGRSCVFVGSFALDSMSQAWPEHTALDIAIKWTRLYCYQASYVQVTDVAAVLRFSIVLIESLSIG